MKITHTEIYRFSIPMEPFVIATGTMHFAQNVLIRVHTDEGIYGVGECSAFPMIVGETQETCIAMAKDFAQIWLNITVPLKVPLTWLCLTFLQKTPGSRSTNFLAGTNAQ
jgi:L-alanine-DL-glutamate epimerase-like enolase superfamily enzyme